LIPLRRVVQVYRPDETVETVLAPKTLSGDPVLPRFVLNLERIL